MFSIVIENHLVEEEDSAVEFSVKTSEGLISK